MVAATKNEIRQWLETGKKVKATHVIIVCDNFDFEDYPVYVRPNEDVRRRMRKYGRLDANGYPTIENDSMQKVMEIYDLSLPIEEQLAEPAAWHF